MSKNTIPKTIHYCWFGGAPLPATAKKCIDSWKKYCPEYEIVEWNESNVDIHGSKFMRAAYEHKKWAFVSDYARYQVIYDNGGIYLDIDVEVIKNLDDLLKNEAYIGFEGREYVNSGLGYGARKGNALIKEILDYYNGIDFEAHKDNISEIATPIIVTNILKKKGFVGNGELQKVGSLLVLPEDYLSPKNPITRLINITSNTYSIHHFDASWVDEKERAFIDKLEEDAKQASSRFPDLVSILIPAYNAEDYLRFAVDSALAQTYKNIEVLVIDDGSTDGTEQIALSYGPRVRYIKKENGGVASALNVGIKSMRGKYFSWLSHDDMYHPQRIEELHKQIIKEDLNTIIISDWDIVDEQGQKLRCARLDDKLETSPRGFLAFDRSTWLNACAMLIPKVLFDKVGLFDESLKTTQDYDMHNRLIQDGVKYKIVHKPLFLSRQHAKQGSLTENNALQMSDDMHVNIIKDLSDDEMLEYFKPDYRRIDMAYDSFVNNGYRQTPAHIASRIIAALQKAGMEKQAATFIQRNLIGYETKESALITSKVLNKIGKKKKKRLLFSSGYWRTGGMERVLSNLFKELGGTYDIILLTPSDGQVGCIKLPDSITHIQMSSRLYVDNFDTIALSHALALEVDVAIGFLNLFGKQLDFYTECKKNGIKTIASNHEYYFYPYKSHDLQIRELAQKRASIFHELDAVLWLTNFSTAVHNQTNLNGYLMHNPNTYEVQAGIPGDTDEKIVMSVGRFNDDVKRIDRIIDCFRLVHKRIPEAKLVLAGKADLDLKIPKLNNRSIADMIKASDVPKQNIIFVGETDNISKYYKKASVYLLASDSEGFPMVLTEAACFGLPVVCNDIPGLEDIVVNHQTGYIVPQDNIGAMADSVCELLLDKDLRIKMGANAKKHSDNFSASVVASKWKLLIDTLTTDKTEKSKRQILAKELSYTVKDRDAYESSLIYELQYSFSQSNLIITDLNNKLLDERVTNRVSWVSRYKALIKRTVSEYRKNGPVVASKKVIKRVINKVKFEIKRTLKFIFLSTKKLFNFITAAVR